MRILLIEDDQNKRERLSAFVAEALPDAEIMMAYSYRSGLEKIINGSWDLLLLDMTLPTYDVSEKEDGFQTEAFAGWNILREMKRRRIVIRTIVVTQFETLGEQHERLSLTELRKKLEVEYPGTYIGSVYYSPSDAGWMTELGQYLKLK